MTNCEMILQYILEHGSITDREAVIDLGVGRLASRICELRKDGYDIISEREKGKNRYGKITYYARYRLADTEGA